MAHLSFRSRIFSILTATALVSAGLAAVTATTASAESADTDSYIGVLKDPGTNDRYVYYNNGGQLELSRFVRGEGRWIDIHFPGLTAGIVGSPAPVLDGNSIQTVYVNSGGALMELWKTNAANSWHLVNLGEEISGAPVASVSPTTGQIEVYFSTPFDELMVKKRSGTAESWTPATSLDPTFTNGFNRRVLLAYSPPNGQTEVYTITDNFGTDRMSIWFPSGSGWGHRFFGNITDGRPAVTTDTVTGDRLMYFAEQHLDFLLEYRGNFTTGNFTARFLPFANPAAGSPFLLNPTPGNFMELYYGDEVTSPDGTVLARQVYSKTLAAWSSPTYPPLDPVLLPTGAERIAGSPTAFFDPSNGNREVYFDNAGAISGGRPTLNIQVFTPGKGWAAAHAI
jgi:hypothetical protein